MTLERLLGAGLAASVLLGVGLLGYHVRLGVDHGAEAAYARELRSFEAGDARLNEDLLRARTGLVGHYDALSLDLAELRRSSRAAAQLPGSLRLERARFVDELRVAEALLARKDALLERFRTQHSALRNSRHVVPVLAARLAAPAATDPALLPLERGLAELLASLLRLDAAPGSPPAVLEVELAQLEQARPLASAAGLERELAHLIDHGHLIAGREAEVDALVRSALAVPLEHSAHLLAELHALEYGRALAAATWRVRSIGLLLALGVALGLALVIVRLRAIAQREHEANRVLERDRAGKLRFFAMTSHQFRTPLSTILSSSQLLLAYAERWDGPRRRTHLGRIEQAARDMSQLHEQIQLIGRGEAGALSVAPARLDLAAFCGERCGAVTQAAAPARAIAFRYAGPERVWLDERLLAHILDNLLENALKYSAPEASVELDVQVDARACDFCLRDTGIGVPESDRARLFESFYRASNVGQIPGSGLGLAVVKQAVLAQGGSVELVSAPGRGTCVRVRLPRAPEASEPAAPARPAPPISPERGEPSVSTAHPGHR